MTQPSTSTARKPSNPLPGDVDADAGAVDAVAPE
jgi:hypothetical protein